MNALVILLVLSVNPPLANGCKWDAVNKVFTAPVSRSCPGIDGIAILTVREQKPGISQANKNPIRIAESVSPCGCNTKTPIYDYIAVGKYQGVTANYLSTYSFKTNPAEKPWLIWVHADGCAPCAKMQKRVENLATAGYVIIIVKANSAEDRAKFKVTLVPTTIAYQGFTETERRVGELTEDQLKEMLGCK